MIYTGNIYAGTVQGGTGVITNLQNGLVLSGSVGELGGPLLHDSSIATNGHGFYIGGTLTSVLGITDNQATYSNPPVQPNGLVRLADLSTQTVAKNKVTGVNSTGTLLTYVVPGTTSLMYNILVVATIDTYTSGNVTVSVSHTDDFGNVGTFSLPALNAVGSSSYPATMISGKNGTNITITATITGTLIANFMSAIQFIF